MNVKVSLVALILTSSLVLSVSPAFAEENRDSSVTGRPQNKNEFLKEKEKKIEAKVTKAAERKTEMQAKVTKRMEERQEKRSALAQKHAANLELQFNNHFTRLMTIASKIQTRIDILKTEGKDTSTAQTKLDAAKASLESAKSLGQDAVAAFTAIEGTTADEQRAQATAAKEKAMAAREALMAALKSLKEAVEALAALRTK